MKRSIPAYALPTPHERPELRSLAERYRVLLDIGRTLTGTLEPEELYREISRQTARVMEATGFYIALYDQARDRATVVFYADRGEEHQVEITYRGSESDVLRTGEGALIGREGGAHPVLLLGDEDTEITRSAVAAPLRYEGRSIGALSAQSYRPDAYDEDDLELLQGVADLAAVAVENARLHQRLQNLSLTDPLTSLPNRRQLELELDREFAAAKRGRSLVVVLFDLDHFKAYNDRYGHVAGDEALRAFAGVLADESRAMNLVARYGGDEFISILTDTDLEGGRLHARRIQERVREHPLLGPAEIGVSWGVAEHVPEHECVSDLIRAADDDLYAAKGVRATTDVRPAGGAGGS